ncbi:MAG: cysteine desulfurase [Oscillospiraceae bacterium]|nr:cysteine desulfurase [Oscillospiraceae bacterium]
MIYLDYSAHTPALKEVIERFAYLESTVLGNANSSHPLGTSAEDIQNGFTRSIASILGVDDDEIVFTSGSSESNNTAIRGIASASRHIGRHILTNPLEHASVSAPLTRLQEQGYDVEMVRIGRDGKIDLGDLEDLIRSDTVLVTVPAVDSELGIIQPVDKICSIIKKKAPRARLHVDATQAIGKIPFSFECGDTFSLTAHKFYGLLGSGLLIRRNDTPLDPLILGGHSNSIYRSGTPTVSLNGALEFALRRSIENLDVLFERISELNGYLREKLTDFPGVGINSPGDAVPHILNISVDGVKGPDFQAALGRRDVCVSVKSACSSDLLPSKAVYAVTGSRKRAMSSWRISLGRGTTKEELDEFINVFQECLKELTR